MRKFFVVAALAGATIASSMIVTTDQAQAQRRWGPAIGLGIAAGVLAGAAIANSGPVYYERRCGWVRSFDRFGNYLGRTWVCSY